MKRTALLTMALMLTAGCAIGTHRVHAHYESPADVLTAVPPCDLGRWKPGMNACRGTAYSGAPTTITGDWTGRTEYAYGWLMLPSGATYAANLETFTGTVDGCGTGSFTYYMTGVQRPDGTVDTRWTVIDGLGTGDFVRLRGEGTLVGVFRDDYTSAGDFRGWVRCRR